MSSSESIRRVSTLDIISDKLRCDQIEALCNTGDVLLCASPCQDRSLTFRIVVSTGGFDSMERRIPLVHAAVIIKDPPADVLETYGIPTAPPPASKRRNVGNSKCRGVYVIEATGSHQDGAVMTPLSQWLDQEYNPLFFGCKVLYRRLKTPDQTTLTNEFWDYVKEARTIPYGANPKDIRGSSHMIYNLLASKGAFMSCLTTITDIAAHNAMKYIFGTGPLGLILGGFFGLLCIPFAALFLIVYMTPAIMKNAKTIAKSGKLCRVVDKSVKRLTCASLAAQVLEKAGLISLENMDASWFHPRDFLPDCIGVHEINLLDAQLKKGVVYSPHLIEAYTSSKKRGSVWCHPLILHRCWSIADDDGDDEHSIGSDHDISDSSEESDEH